MQTANGIVFSTKEAKVHMQELGTHLYVKLVRYCLWDEDAMSWVTLTRGNREKIPNQRKMRRLLHATLTTLFFSSRSQRKKLHNGSMARQRKGELLCQERSWRRLCFNLLESESIQPRGACSPWAEGGVVRKEGAEYGPVAFLVQDVCRLLQLDFRRNKHG